MTPLLTARDVPAEPDVMAALRTILPGLRMLVRALERLEGAAEATARAEAEYVRGLREGVELARANAEID